MDAFDERPAVGVAYKDVVKGQEGAGTIEADIAVQTRLELVAKVVTDTGKVEDGRDISSEEGWAARGRGQKAGQIDDDMLQLEREPRIALHAGR